MKKLFTDASFDWTNTTETVEEVVRGKIAIHGEGISVVEKVAVGKVPGLKQYINVFELIALARAVELASLQGWDDKSMEVHTDSKVAMFWAMAGTIKPKVRTEAHTNALEYLRKARIQFGGIVTFFFVPRLGNPAGHLLQAELDAGAKPHDA